MDGSVAEGYDKADCMFRSFFSALTSTMWEGLSAKTGLVGGLVRQSHVAIVHVNAESKSSCRKSGQVHLTCNHHSLTDRQIVRLILIIVVSLVSGRGTMQKMHKSHQ